LPSGNDRFNYRQGSPRDCNEKSARTMRAPPSLLSLHVSPYNSCMRDPARPVRGSITESPWYWVYLFCTAGLIALMLVGPRFSGRQVQIERNAEARQRAAQLVAGRNSDALPEPGPPLESASGTRIRLWPLYVVLGCLLGVAWLNLWRHRRPAPRALVSAAEEAPS